MDQNPEVSSAPRCIHRDSIRVNDYDTRFPHIPDVCSARIFTVEAAVDNLVRESAK